MSGIKKKSEGFWSRLQPSERRLVALLIGVALVMGAAIVVMLRVQKVTAAETEIESLRSGIEMLHLRGPAYQEKLVNKSKREAKISDVPIVFGTVIEKAEGIAGISVSGQEEQAPVELEGGLRMRTVEFSIRNVTLEQLTLFLATLESEAGRVVLVQNLLIRSSSANEDSLNATVEVGTWERYSAETIVEDN